MIRPFAMKLAILVGAVVTATVLTVYRPSPQGLIPFGVGQAEVRAAPGTPPTKAKGSYELAALKVFNQTFRRAEPVVLVPAGSVVVAGSLPSAENRCHLYCAVIVKQVDAKTRAKTSINELLRA